MYLKTKSNIGAFSPALSVNSMVFEGLSHSRITSGTTPGARKIIAGAMPDEQSDDRPALFFVKRDLFAEGHGLGVPCVTGKRIGGSSESLSSRLLAYARQYTARGSASIDIASCCAISKDSLDPV